MTLVLFVTLCDTALFFGQTRPSTNQPNDDQSLTMTRIGDGYMFARHAAFRTYETSDHTEALVWYGTFRTEQEAKHEIKGSLKQHKVTGREHVKDSNGHVIGDRIVAAPKQQEKAFMVIQRQGLNYWIIQSTSLAVAKQVAGLIDPLCCSNPVPADGVTSTTVSDLVQHRRALNRKLVVVPGRVVSDGIEHTVLRDDSCPDRGVGLWIPDSTIENRTFRRCLMR